MTLVIAGKKGNFLRDMHSWLRVGHIHIQETVYKGLHSWPTGFGALFSGGNLGKVVVKL